MGQAQPKYFMPPAPYGSSIGANAVNPVQKAVQNPQNPLLPPGFSLLGQSNAQAGGTNQQAPTASGTVSALTGGGLGPLLPYLLGGNGRATY